MRILGVPMIDRRPIETGAEVSLSARHQVSREGAEVAELIGVIGGNDESEKVPVIRASLDKGLAIDGLVAPAEQMPGLPVTRDTIALQIGDVCLKRRSACRPAHDPCLDHGGTGATSELPRRNQCGRAAAAKDRVADVWRGPHSARLLSGLQRNREKGLCPLGPCRADATRPDGERAIISHMEELQGAENG